MFRFERGLRPRNPFLGEASEGAAEAPSDGTLQMGPYRLPLGAEKGPAARRRPTAAREAYSLYVPLGGGLRPPSETSPQDSLRRQSRRSKAEHFHVGRRATDEDLHGPALNVPVRARASPAQPIPGGGFGGGRRGPLR